MFQSINEGGNVVFISELMLEADLTSEVIHLFIFFFPALKCNQLTCLRKRLKTVFYSVNVEEAQSLLWVVWFRIKLKSLFLKHSCADITLICARRQLVYFSSVCQTSFYVTSLNLKPIMMPVLYLLRRGRRLLVNFCSCVLQNTIRRFQKTDGCGSGNLCCYQASCCRYFSSCFALFRSGL